jgi:formamidopyrimidine-DNA glycosylase
MPELPDLTVYVEALRARVAGARLDAVRLGSPFLLRTVDPPLDRVFGRRAEAVSLLGKRIVVSLEGEVHVVVHLMVAGRLHWRPRGAKLEGRRGLAAFDFEAGTLTLTEAGSKRRASLHVVSGADGLRALDRGGIDVMVCPADAFRRALMAESHTLKRALTDPRLFSGIGNAYSDEILHAARLSPLQLTRHLDAAEVERLLACTRTTLAAWTERLRRQAAGAFPEKVTAFHEEMAVHGRFGKPCPDCGAPIQRIVYADNEANYCARCQTGGRRLADRAMSRLLREDWPRTLDDTAD